MLCTAILYLTKYCLLIYISYNLTFDIFFLLFCLIKTYVNWKPVRLRFEGNSYFYSSRLFSIDFDQLIWWDEFVWILTLGQKLLKQLFSHFYLIPTQDFFWHSNFSLSDDFMAVYLLYEVCKTLGFRSSARFESRNDF